MEDCIFCKIIAGKIPCKRIFEDADVLAFHDIHPVAPVHFMLIPKLHIDSLVQVNSGHQMLLGKMLALASKLAVEQGCGDGWHGHQHRTRRAPRGVSFAHTHHRRQ